MRIGDFGCQFSFFIGVKEPHFLYPKLAKVLGEG